MSTLLTAILLQLASGVEVLERLGDALGHALLAFTDPHAWVVVPITLSVSR
jgi:hypothetical protein